MYLGKTISRVQDSFIQNMEVLARSESGSEYTNTCPGPQGNRQSQAVACSDFWFG